MAGPRQVIEEEIGGVQGSDVERGRPVAIAFEQEDGGETVEVPDAGEIEWAGVLVKKAPGGPDA